MTLVFAEPVLLVLSCPRLYSETRLLWGELTEGRGSLANYAVLVLAAMFVRTPFFSA